MKRTEESEQVALFEYAAYQREPEWSLLFSIPNGGYRKLKTGARLKRTGLKSRIPDIFLPVGKGMYNGLFVEMKSDRGTVQKNQKEWHTTLRTQGYRVDVCRGCGPAVRTIEGYLQMSTWTHQKSLWTFNTSGKWLLWRGRRKYRMQRLSIKGTKIISYFISSLTITIKQDSKQQTV